MNNFAIMRHAATNSDEEIAPESLDILTRVARVLAEKIRATDTYGVHIFHSPLKRAEVTAHALAEELSNNGVNDAFVSALSWLGCELYAIHGGSIADAAVSDEFTVFVTHRPDMIRYLEGIAYDGDLRVTNCAVYSPEFVIKGH